MMRTRPVLVTGGAGFIGCNLADQLAARGYDVLIYDNLSRPGVENNLDYLRARHPRRISAVIADIDNPSELAPAASDAQAVFHLAAQVAVTSSLIDPLEDFSTNCAGTFGLLEILRVRNPQAPLLFASTNKVYGNLADVPLDCAAGDWQPVELALRAHGIDEQRTLDFHTPYGCSKGAADQYVLDYARHLGLRSCVLRMSCIYGPHQMGTEEQGWVAHFLRHAFAGEPITLYGDGRQVRDILHVDDAVAAYLSAWAHIDEVSGEALNLGGGPANAVSLLRLLDYIEAQLGRRVDLHYQDWRAGDQRWFVTDRRKAQRLLGLPAPRDWRSGVADLADWLRDAYGYAPARSAAGAVS